MPLKPGQSVLDGGDVSETRAPAGGTIVAGTPVMLDGNGEMAGVDTESGDLYGVALHDDENDGRGNACGLEGPYVVAAASGVAAGNHVNGGNATGGSTGQVIAESGGPAKALSDTGGTWQGYTVPDGHAVVYF